MFSFPVLVGSLFFAVHVNGLVTRSPLEPLLLARQSTNPLDVGSLPTQCQAPCSGIATTLGSCTTNACLCTNANGAALKTCVECIVGIAPSASLTTQGQQILDGFVGGCSGSVAPITLGGSTGGGASGGGLASPSPSVTVPPPFAGASSSPGSAPTRTATTGLGSSPSPSSDAIAGSSGNEGSNPFNSPNAAGRAAVGVVGWAGLAVGAILLL